MVTITINKSAVLRNVRRTSEYVGQKSGSYDAVRMLKADSEQGEQWFADALAGVLRVLDRVRRGVEVSGDNIVLTLDIGNNAEGRMGQLLTRYFAAVLTARWLRLSAPSLVEAYAADEQTLLAEIERVAYYREMPY